MSLKPLYLDAGTGWRVLLDDGPSLRVVGGLLHDAIGDAEVIGWPRPGLNLVAEFADLLGWEAHAALHGLAVLAVRDAPASRLAAHLLEARGERLAGALGRLLGGFELWLREWLL